MSAIYYDTLYNALLLIRKNMPKTCSLGTEIKQKPWEYSSSYAGQENRKCLHSFRKCKPKWVSLVAQMVRNPTAMWETQVQSLGWEDPLEKGNGNPLQYSCLEKSYGQRSPAGCNLWGHKESDMTERWTLWLSLKLITVWESRKFPRRCKSLQILLIYFWLCYVFIAAHGLSPVAVSRGYCLVAMHGLLILVASLVQSMSSRYEFQ